MVGVSDGDALVRIVLLTLTMKQIIETYDALTYGITCLGVFVLSSHIETVNHSRPHSLRVDDLFCRFLKRVCAL